MGKIVNFCELGPGNGTLTEDLIKNLTYFYREDLNFFLVEKTNHIDFKSIFKRFCLPKWSQNPFKMTSKQSSRYDHHDIGIMIW